MKRQYLALRGLAILLVVLNHSIYFGTTIPRDLGYQTASGLTNYLFLTLQLLDIFSVPTFLFLSGCFFTYAAHGQDQKSLLKTVRVNLRIILWPYLIWSIMSYAVVSFTLDERYSLLQYVKHLITGYPYNFIPILVFFYCVSPILIPIGKRYPFVLIGMIGLYQLLLVNLRTPNSLGFEYPEWVNVLAPPVIWRTLAQWGIYFPLGIVISLHERSVSPVLGRLRWLFVIGTVVLFGLALVDRAGIRTFPLAKHLAPFAFVFLLPLIRRDSIPLVHWFEQIGKRAYGLYLAHLLTIFIALYLVEIFIDDLFLYPLILVLCLFVLAVWIPITLMKAFERLPTQVAYRYVFG